MEVTVCLDWLRYSAPNGYQLQNMIPHELYIDYSKPIQPLPHYTAAYEIYPAGRIDTNTINEKQGSLATFGGSDLREIASNGISPYFLMSYTAEKKFLHASRVDLAIDVTGRDCNPSAIIRAWRRGKIKTHARECNQIIGYDEEKQRSGNTVTLGSRTSETFPRIYDKRLEQGGKGGELWTRIEFELKKGKARAAHAASVEHSLTEIVASTVKSYMAVEGVQWWTDVMNALPDASEFMRGERKQKEDTSEEWLHGVCLRKISNAIKQGDTVVIDEVLKALIYHGNNQPIDRD